jgi:hypothetical protein
MGVVGNIMTLEEALALQKKVADGTAAKEEAAKADETTKVVPEVAVVTEPTATENDGGDK